MTHTLDPAAIRRLTEGTTRIDDNLPRWARRSHPIVRQQLGIYWKTLPLEVELWTRLLILQVGLVLLALPFPLLYSFVMPIVTVSIILVPGAFYVYGLVLMQIGRRATDAMFTERRSNTLALLRVTPLALHEIFFSKIAASIWRNLDNLSLVFSAHVLLSLPLLVLQYANIFGPGATQSAQTVVAIILALLVNMLRLFLEPVMVGALGLLFGTFVNPRIAAEIITITLSAVYFAFINLPRLLPLGPTARLLVDFALPLGLPVIITVGALAATRYLIHRD